MQTPSGLIAGWGACCPRQTPLGRFPDDIGERYVLAGCRGSIGGFRSLGGCDGVGTRVERDQSDCNGSIVSAEVIAVAHF